MKVRALDKDGDMQFGLPSGKGWLVDSPQAVGQLVKSALSLWRGEWFLDTSLGVPMFENILRRGATEEGIADVLRTEVSKVPGVVSVVYVGVTIDHLARKVSASVELVSAYGRTKVTV